MNKDQIAVSLMCMDFLKIKEQLEVLNESTISTSWTDISVRISHSPRI